MHGAMLRAGAGPANPKNPVDYREIDAAPGVSRPSSRAAQTGKESLH